MKITTQEIRYILSSQVLPGWSGTSLHSTTLLGVIELYLNKQVEVLKEALIDHDKQHPVYDTLAGFYLGQKDYDIEEMEEDEARSLIQNHWASSSLEDLKEVLFAADLEDGYFSNIDDFLSKATYVLTHKDEVKAMLNENGDELERLLNRSVLPEWL